MPGLALHYIMGQEVYQMRHICNKEQQTVVFICSWGMCLMKGLWIRLHLARGAA